MLECPLYPSVVVFLNKGETLQSLLYLLFMKSLTKPKSPPRDRLALDPNSRGATWLIRKYLILHIFNRKGESCALFDSRDGEMKPSSIIIFRMIRADPDIELNRSRTYMVGTCFLSIAAVSRIKVRINGVCSQLESVM